MPVGHIRAPLPVKLIVPMLSARSESFSQAQGALTERYGPLDYVSADIPFTYTDYYAPELGSGILRRFVSARELIDPGDLASIKLWTNALEDTWREGGHRVINLDPGYICGGKLVLATTKDQAHRIYLGQGIYAEVTLLYRAREYRALPWTYPDYASADYHRVFSVIRAGYMAQLRTLRTAPPSLDDQADV
ncbi:MAG: DUF4416 family protein [Anaerolineae bacterium]